MIDKAVLKQYQDLKKEIEENTNRVKKLENRLDRIRSGGDVVDTVKGGEGGIQHFRIEGFPSAEYSRVKTQLLMRKVHLNALIEESTEAVVKVDEFISGVTDVHIRRILEFRYMDGLPWIQVAMKMGGNDTEESVQMALKRFLEKM